MKQFVRSLYILALTSVAMVGCSKDPSSPGGAGNKMKVMVTTNIDRGQSSIQNNVQSRVNDNQWTYGDMIGIYMLKKGGSIANSDDIIMESANRQWYVDNQKGNYIPANEKQALFYPLTYPNPAPDGHDFDFVAYHPYTPAAQMTDFKIPIDIATNKPVLTAQGKSKWYDYLQQGVKAEPVDLTFKHQMARIKLNIEVAEGGGMLDSDLRGMTVTFVNANAKGQYNILDNKFEADVTLANTAFKVDKNIATTEQKDAEIVVTGSTATLIVIPNAGTKKDNGNAYPIANRSLEFKLRPNPDRPTAEVYPISHPLDNDVTFEAGKEYIYKIIIDRDQVKFVGWEVEEWTPGPEVVVEDEDVMDMDELKYRRAVYNPNSLFWISNARTNSSSSQEDRITFPIKKAFAMWKYDRWLAQSNLGEIPDLTAVGNEDKVITGEIIWGDDPDVAFYTVKFSDARPTYKSNMIVTYTKLLPVGSMAPSINMLIGLKVGTKQPDGSTVYEDFYRWCWHIWVVPADGANPLTNENTSNYDHDMVRDGANLNLPSSDPDYGKKDYTKEYLFLGRNLGSKGGDKDIKTGGLYYQWGRPTPFPGPANFDGSEYPKLYKVVNKVAEVIPTTNGLISTIQGPLSDIKDIFEDPSAFVTSATGNWINPTFNEFLWTDAKKSPWDPCPDGWRVPAFQNKHNPSAPMSPWNNPQLATLPVDPTKPVPAEETDPAKYEGVFTNTATSKGYDFTPKTDSKSQYLLKWYPFAGYRKAVDGTMTDLGTVGYNWASSLDKDGKQQFFSIDATAVNPYAKAVDHTANAMPVRCVKVK